MSKIQLITPHVLGNEQKYVDDAIKSNWIAPLGPYVKKFEDMIAEYVSTNYAVACSSGTAAIHLALKALGIGKGDKVAVSDLTFIASANPIVYEGAEPVFIDCEPHTYNMSSVALKKALEENSIQAVIVVHCYGMPADMDEILEICNYHGIPVIEDATESLGATYKGKQTGTFGVIGCFSFNGNKIITTAGGGMCVTDDPVLDAKMMYYATQSREPVPHYEHKEIGFNYRLSNLSAAFGCGQAEKLTMKILLKDAIYNAYQKELNDSQITMFKNMGDRISNHWISCGVMSSARGKDLVDFLAQFDIEARQIWKPLHRQPVFKDCKFYGHIENGCISDMVFEHGICLPSDTNMTKTEQSFVIEKINEFLRRVEHDDV